MSEELFPDFNTPKKNGPQKRPRIETQQKSAKYKKVSKDAIQIVFDHWVQTMGKRKNSVLNHIRTVAIGAAIFDYGVEDCKRAIEGCKVSEWHMGRNPQNRIYDDIELILRGPKQIDRFLELHERFNKESGADPF
jgi:hypothetical protein